MESSETREFVPDNEKEVHDRKGDKSFQERPPLSQDTASGDVQLIRGINKGDHSTFTLLVHTTYPNLCDYAFGYTRNVTDAEEIVQDLFVKLWNKRDAWNPTTTVKAYLFRAVRNLCINYLRDRANRKTLLATFNANHEPFSPAENFDTTYHELSQELRKAIDELPERRREIFLLNRLHGLTYAEVAAALDVSVNTVDTQIRRALDQLRPQFSAYLR